MHQPLIPAGGSEPSTAKIIGNLEDMMSENLLGPMEKGSAHFHEKVIKPGISTSEPRYRNALFHLLCSQMSDFRYWGSGTWPDYGREICCRLEAILEPDF